jgi:hypothetical protein
MPESVQPATTQMLARFSTRLFLELQEERKEPSHQLPIADTVPRDEFDSLKSLVYDMKA